MCKKQTSVSHSSTEAEIISLDAGSRVDGIPAVTLWDLVIEIFHSPPNQTNKTKDVRDPRWNLSAKTQPNMQKQIPTMHTNLDLANIDHVSSNVSCFGLVVWQNNLGSKIQIRYVDTKHQLADVLTKGNFTCDEWNNLLHLVNISHFSSTCCAKNSSVISFSTMAKMIQKSKRRRRKSCVQVATSSDEYVFLFYCDKFLRRIESACI